MGDHSHCFLSQTDLSTQLQWQRAEDPHGNPFVAIVVDPLRSSHLDEPEIKAFRAYPPEYTSPTANECPNGVVELSEQSRLELWGSCWNRYYELDVEYFMSSVSRKVLEQLTQDYLWIRTLNRQPESSTVQKLVAATKQCEVASQTPAAAAPAVAATGGRSPALSRSAAAGAGGTTARTMRDPAVATRNTVIVANPKIKEWKKAVNGLLDVADEQLCEANLQKTKEAIFS